MVCNKKKKKKEKRKPVFIKRKWNHVVFSRATILSFHPVSYIQVKDLKYSYSILVIFKDVRPIDKNGSTLTGTTITPNHSRLGSKDNEGLLYTLQIFSDTHPMQVNVPPEIHLQKWSSNYSDYHFTAISNKLVILSSNLISITWSIVNIINF